jgi:SSS family solute:Na+ symporter
VCVIVTVGVSLATTPKSAAELTGLVYGYTPIPKEENVPLLHKPAFWAGVALVLFVILQVVFW